jgi:hypothetical protein
VRRIIGRRVDWKGKVHPPPLDSAFTVLTGTIIAGKLCRISLRQWSLAKTSGTIRAVLPN